MVDEIRAIFQNTVVDIQATSRYGDDADTAFVTSTILLESERAVAEYAEFGDVTPALGGRMIQIRRVDRIRANEEGVFWYSFESPTGPAPLMKNGDYSLVILLPRSGMHPVGPIFDVDLVDHSKPNNARAFGAGALPHIGNRIAVSFHNRQDPGDEIWYLYRQITGGG